jgi:hypothetical protein
MQPLFFEVKKSSIKSSEKFSLLDGTFSETKASYLFLLPSSLACGKCGKLFLTSDILDHIETCETESICKCDAESLHLITAADVGFYVSSRFKDAWGKQNDEASFFNNIFKYKFSLCAECLRVKEGVKKTAGKKSRNEIQDIHNFDIYFKSSFSDSKFKSQKDLILSTSKTREKSFLSPSTENTRGLRPLKNKENSEYEDKPLLSPSPTIKTSSFFAPCCSTSKQSSSLTVKSLYCLNTITSSSPTPNLTTKVQCSQTKNCISDASSYSLSEKKYLYHPWDFPVLVPSKNHVDKFFELSGKYFAYDQLGIPICNIILIFSFSF